jgi:Flp pilus assembly pilin Flp
MKFVSKARESIRRMTPIEWGLIAALIAVVIVTGVTTPGTSMRKAMSNAVGQPSATTIDRPAQSEEFKRLVDLTRAQRTERGRLALSICNDDRTCASQLVLDAEREAMR